MFRQLAIAPLSAGPSGLVELHTTELAALLELAWNHRLNDTVTGAPPGFSIGHPDRRSDISGIVDALLAPLATSPNASAFFRFAVTPPPPPPPPPPAHRVGWRWGHLVYAYMIENTRIYEIFRLVLHEFLHGEKLGAASSRSQIWLRNTEELFYRDPPPFFITTISSHIRADLRASRRNAYQRMFGMDLNHGTDDNKPYLYVKAEAANKEFVPTFEEFLREVWIGMTHWNSTTGARPIDDAKIANLASRLHEMLMSRRTDGTLSREEFAIVSAMSWFHLTVETATLPIVQDLKAQAEGVEQRLFKIAERVGLPAHGLSKSYFDIADPISRILIAIESGAYDNSAAVPALYTPSPPAPSPSPEPDMRAIITHWSVITGRDMKAGKVAPS